MSTTPSSAVQLVRSPLIFISCAYQDEGFAEQLCVALRNAGVSAWSDRVQRDDGLTHDDICAALDESAILVIIVSSELTSSDWGMLEIGVAAAKSKRTDALVIPIVSRPSTMPIALRRIPSINAQGLLRSQVFARIKMTISEARLAERHGVLDLLAEQSWEDAGQPDAMAFPAESRQHSSASADASEVMPLPERPEAIVYRLPNERWLFEVAGTPIEGKQLLNIDGVEHRLVFVDAPAPSHADVLKDENDASLSHVRLTFVVSHDSERVELRASIGTTEISLGDRASSVLLLLARARIRDREKGVREAECGWISIEDLARLSSQSPEQLDVAIHRVRREFSARLTEAALRPGSSPPLRAPSVASAANIIERRSEERSLRLGTSSLEIRDVGRDA